MTKNMRSELNSDLDVESFRRWYWLKDELVQFCRENKMPSSGSKEELTKRIANFLTTGEIKHSISEGHQKRQKPRSIYQRDGYENQRAVLIA